jgi:hypothetical protein
MEQLGSPFRLLAKGLDVSRMNAELGAHPELWDAHKERRVAPGSPHGGMRDIWVRYNDRRPFERVGNFTAINDRHVPIWYDAAKLLPSVKEFALDLTQKTRAEMLCGVLISKIPPGAGIERHVDRGWHAENTSKLYLALRSPRRVLSSRPTRGPSSLTLATSSTSTTRRPTGFTTGPTRTG